jgi:hypothetical protein
MAEKPTGKPRRDLRARLGKTITPKTGGGAPEGEDPAAAPSVASAAAPAAEGDAPVAVAAPVAAPTPTPAPRAVKASTPAPMLSGGIAAPPAAIGAAPIPNVGIAAPPFARQVAAPIQQEAPSDPFAAQRVEQKVVRIEFDDKPVADSEVGKARLWITVAVCVVIGAVALGIGFMGGQTVKERDIFDRTVRDAVEVHGHVNTARRTLETADQKVRQIVTQMAPQNDGTPAHVDRAGIEALRGLERPFRAQQFTDKNYNALGPAVVNDLFTYLMNVERLFQEFENLAALALPEANEREINEGLQNNAAAQTYGAVLRRDDQGRLVAGLAFLEVGAPAEEGGQPTITARPVRTAQGIQVQIYAGSGAGEDEDEVVAAPVITTTRQYAVLVDNQDSPLLREIQGLSARYQQKLAEILALLRSTVEIQGRMLTAIDAAITEAGGPPAE